jgi:hypothetical protein
MLSEQHGWDPLFIRAPKNREAVAVCQLAHQKSLAADPCRPSELSPDRLLTVNCRPVLFTFQVPYPPVEKVGFD